MSTENERKFVLRSDLKPGDLTPKRILRMSQGYLCASRGLSLRVRKTEFKNKTVCHLTFKSTVNGGRVVEIEKKMDRRDFHDLWPYCMSKLEKDRLEIKSDGLCWEVDFFRDHNDEVYFIMAEVELEEGRFKPEVVPDFIADNLVYEVPKSDCRFSSKLLSDVRYAKLIYNQMFRTPHVTACGSTECHKS